MCLDCLIYGLDCLICALTVLYPTFTVLYVPHEGVALQSADTAAAVATFDEVRLRTNYLKYGLTVLYVP